MSQFFRPLTAIVAIACATTGALAQGNASSRTSEGNFDSGATVTDSDRDFVKKAAQINLAELQAATMALLKARDPAAKDFARHMLEDHTRVNGQLRRLAQSKGVVLPTVPSVLHKSKLRVLDAYDGSGFDRKYADEFGVEAHQVAIRRFRQVLDHGGDPDVKEFARQTMPVLEQHLQRAQGLHASLQDPARASDDGRQPTAQLGATRASAGGEANEARKEIHEAVQVVQRMKADPAVTDLLQRARGVFILPDYGRAALGVGIQGGEGVLVTRQGESFSNPVFYDLAGVSVGAQAGVSGGQLALLLMTDKAVREFKSAKKFSLNADAGLTIANYSRREHASAGKVQDVILWSGTKGAYAGVSIGLNDVMFDEEANRAYYGRDGLDPSRIIDGAVANPGSNVLGMVLAV